MSKYYSLHINVNLNDIQYHGYMQPDGIGNAGKCILIPRFLDALNFKRGLKKIASVIPGCELQIKIETQHVKRPAAKRVTPWNKGEKELYSAALHNVRAAVSLYPEQLHKIGQILLETVQQHNAAKNHEQDEDQE